MIEPPNIETLLAAAGFIFGLAEYRKSQKWKSLEWVAKEASIIIDNPKSISALQMLEWGNRDIALYHLNNSSDKTSITDHIVYEALRMHESSSSGRQFSDSETAIRDCFDTLLDGMQRMYNQSQTRLFNVGDLQPYFGYISHIIYNKSKIELANAKNNKESRFIALKEYIKQYYCQRQEDSEKDSISLWAFIKKMAEMEEKRISKMY